ILQADKATEVPQGEYEIEGFFTRLNHLLRNQNAEILITRTLPLPASTATEELLVIVQADGQLALEFRVPQASLSMTEDGGVNAGNGRLYPALPAAERKAVLAAELARQKNSLQDIGKQLEKLPPTTPLQLTQQAAEQVAARQTAVTYLEAFSACKATVRECDKQARAAAGMQ
ncbi:MAG: hypothetical protein RSH52_34095, partial [Janthinobacterium sp.]